MALEPVFTAANLVALVGWLLLIVTPAHHPMRRAVPTLIVVLLSILYVGLIAYALPRADGGFGSLADVRALFQTDAALLAGWVHYLAFDLFVGSWITRDATALNVNRLLLAPFLALTFLFGPAGYLAYQVFRSLTRQHRTAPAPEVHA